MKKIAGLFILVGLFFAALEYTPSQAAQAMTGPLCPTSTADLSGDPLIICGSVEQIYIVNAPANAFIDVAGPQTYSLNADANGGLVIRDVPVGVGYTVTVGDDMGVSVGVDPSLVVAVEAPTDHPAQIFYDSQVLGQANDGFIMTRDATFLDYYLRLPSGGCSAGDPCDILVTYSGYTPGLEPQAWEEFLYDQFDGERYAIIGVNMRGSGCSGGSFDLMENIVSVDGYDIVETLSAQDWIDDVVLTDRSWPGLSQLFVAATQPPSLDAIATGSPVADFYRDVFYPSGMLNSGFGSFWLAGRDVSNAYPSSNGRIDNEISGGNTVCDYNQRLRGQNVNSISARNAHPFYDDYWMERTADVSAITVPTLMIVSQQDPQTGTRVAASIAAEFNPSTPVRLYTTNGGHDVFFFDNAETELKRFINVYTADNPSLITSYEAEETVLVDLETVADGSSSRTSFTLPELLQDNEGTRYNFGLELTADDEFGSTETSVFEYDPDPLSFSWNPIVQEQVRFTSTPLTEDVLMAGSASADLWFELASTDADIRVSISELREDGREMFIQNGWLRASHRALDGASTDLRPVHTHASGDYSLVTADTPTFMRLEINPFVHLFSEGSQIRITIDAAPGPGGGFVWIYDVIPGVFDTTILHNSTHRSSINLPIVSNPSLVNTLSDTGLPSCTELAFLSCRVDSYMILSSVIDSTSSEDGDTAIVEFELNAQPTADVTLPLSVSDSTEASLSPSSLTFTTSNWDDPSAHRVTITGLDDTDDDGAVSFSLVTGDPTSADANFSVLSATDVDDITLFNNDNEGTNTDADGVEDDIEQAAPNTGDYNNDGTSDAQQSNVATFIHKPTDTYVATQVAGECSTITGVDSYLEEELADDADNAYLLGLHGVDISCTGVGGSATVTHYWDKSYDTSNWTYKKFVNGVYVDLDVTYAIVNIGAKDVTTVTFTLTDGGEYDADGVVNGVIIDPAGPAIDGELIETGSTLISSFVVGPIVLLSTTGVFMGSYKRARLYSLY